MASGLFFLLVIGGLLVFLAVGVRLAMPPSASLTRDQKKELADSRAMIRRLEKMALQYRQTDDTGLAQVFLDEIENSKMKELE